jgi:hypothetical protein
MNGRGVFAVDRGIWSHPLLDRGEPFTRREAWLWLVSEAAWKPHQHRVGGRTIEVGRGQVVHSLRFMAAAWRWPEPNVRRLIRSLVSDAMVDAATDAGITIITICNYNKYQRVSLPTDAPSDAETDARVTQERRRLEDRETIKDKEKPSLRSGAQTRNGTRLPDDWQPSEDDIAYAFDHGVSGTRLSDTIEEFKNYWQSVAGKDALKANWSKTFRNRVLQIKDRPRPKGQSDGPALKMANTLLDWTRE